MTITAGSAQAKRARRTRPSASDGGSGRSGAALRAYERRQQRASVQGGGSVSSSHAATRLSNSGVSVTARIPFVALIIGLLTLGLGLTLLLTTRSAGDSYDLSEAKAYNERLVQQKSSLQRDVQLADSAPELARKAADLGMIPAANAARLLVAPDGSVQVVGTPGPAQGEPVAPLDPPMSQGTLQAINSAVEESGTQRSAQSRRLPAAANDSRLRSFTTTVPPATSATPNSLNDARSEALTEQLVPMSTTPSVSPTGSRQ